VEEVAKEFLIELWQHNLVLNDVTTALFNNIVEKRKALEDIGLTIN